MGLFGSGRKRGFAEQALNAWVKHQKSETRRQEAALAKRPKREILDPVEDGEEFPLGVRGMRPVVTTYAGGKTNRCYAFTSEESCRKLEELTERINEILDEASGLSEHCFGTIETVEARPQDEGFGFTRADYSPVTSSGNPSPTPLKVRLETSSVPCSVGSYSGTVSFTPAGELKKVEVTEWVTPHFAFRVTATLARGTFGVRKIEKLGETSNDSTVLFKR